MWNLATNPRFAIHELVRNIGARVCWGCGARDRALELEHIRPLWSLTAAERLELKWWLPFNLQLLCRECHRAKSARETRQRFARESEREMVEIGQPPLLPGLRELAS